MSKKDLINAIEVKSPCTENWDEMQGNNTVRFCSHCAKNVNNISEMTRKETMRLVRSSGGSLCVRYVSNPATRRPIFADKFHQIVRRTPGIAAGVMSASIALTTATYAQTNDSPQQGVEIVNEVKSGPAGGTISGYATDPNGAALAYALVGLFNEETNEYRVMNASGEVFYEFKDLASGKYKLKIEAGGFEAREITSIALSEGSQVRRDAHMALQQVDEVVQVGGPNDPSTNYVVVGGSIAVTVTGPINKLVEAVYNEDLEEVTQLIARGARVNSKDKNNDGITALHAAIEMGNAEIAQLLLSSGAKINGRDSLKRTPLMMLDDDATPELLQLLLRYGAKIDLADKKGLTALSHYAKYSDPEMVRLFVAAGANVNAANKLKETPLLIATRGGNLDIVRVLLESGANANPRNKANETAWGVADDTNIRTLLETYGAIAETR